MAPRARDSSCAVRSSRPRRVDVEADACLALLAIAAAAAGDVEWHRYQITDFDEFHVAPGFDHLACDLVPQN